MKEDAKIFKIMIGGREVSFETGRLCEQANGSCLVRAGETVIMVNVTMAKEPRPGIDFFPLAVDFEEKMYSVGKIPGGFKKREGRPSDKAILTSRLIDRPLRPLFPKVPLGFQLHPNRQNGYVNRKLSLAHNQSAK